MRFRRRARSRVARRGRARRGRRRYGRRRGAGPIRVGVRM